MVNLTIDHLMKAGLHYGNLIGEWNPKMAPYIYGIRNNIHIIDLEKTLVSIRRAINLVQEVKKANGTILFVGTDEISSQCVRYYAKKSGNLYLHKKWFGGLLTNWNHFSKYLSNLSEMENQINLGKIENTKEIKKYRRLTLSMEGIRTMKNLPSLLFVCNRQDHEIAIREAKQVNIPVIAILDTDCDPEGVTYPIPANNDNITSVKLICELIMSSNS